VGFSVHLFNVRKGQFVFYNNQLHKVYSVKPFFKQSVHLIRLHDYEQQLAAAREIDYYKPKHLDSFIFNHKRYTLDKNKHAQVGDYILVIHPRPDSLDHHHLHAMEKVSSIEDNGVISNKLNGIKHSEYWVMVPGLEPDATIIDLQQPEMQSEEPETKQPEQDETIIPEPTMPRIGDVFQKRGSDPLIHAMVIAIKGETIYLGGDLKVTRDDLADSDQWSFLHNVLEY